MSSDSLSTRRRWFAHAHLLDRYLTRSRRAFSATLTTTTLDRSSLRWFATTPCRATAEDHQPKRTGPSITGAAPQHLDLTFYVTPPVVFVVAQHPETLRLGA
jgi:hypothetical protein